MRSFSTETDGSGGAIADPAHDLFVTETMAELSARQGRTADAIAIYRRLLAAGAGDRRERWERRLVELEGAALSGARGPADIAPPPKTSPAAPPSRALSPEQAASPALHAQLLHVPLLIDRPVRSGQIVYAEGRDLLVLAPVNPGAQLLADGHIHVYGPLRGRAVAGVRGWLLAQIFCQRLEAELVGIDAAYLAADDLPADLLGKPARIWLDQGACRAARLPGA